MGFVKLVCRTAALLVAGTVVNFEANATYIANDPLNGTDPTGECQIAEDGTQSGICFTGENDDLRNASNDALGGLFEVQPELGQLEATLIEQGATVPIEFTNSAISSFDPDTNVVRWNPSDTFFAAGTTAANLESGKNFTAGVVPISPLETLVHELGHAEAKFVGGGLDFSSTQGVENSISLAGAEQLSVVERNAIQFTNQFRGRTGNNNRRLGYGAAPTARRCGQACPGAGDRWRNNN